MSPRHELIVRIIFTAKLQTFAQRASRKPNILDIFGRVRSIKASFMVLGLQNFVILRPHCNDDNRQQQ
jgi:hypothetical protein